MSCDTARNHIGAQRGTSLAMAVSVAISATILLLIGSPIIARAATIEEVARCRAIQIKRQQWDCFKYLKAPKQNAPKAKRDDTRQSQKEDVPKVKGRREGRSEGADERRSEGANGGRPEGANGGRPEGANGGRSEGEKARTLSLCPSEACKQRRMTPQALRPLIIFTS